VTGRVAEYAELTKPRITILVLVTTLVGYLLGTEGQVQLGRLVHALLATGLVAAGASALNQFLERDADGRMRRTRRRPLPSGRIAPERALGFAIDLATLGVIWLAVAVNWASALVAALTLAVYLLVYTPLKRRTPWCTAVGAVPGALPPVIGWVAARGQLGEGALILFAILFLWQLPHFFAIAWLYREDYARGGFPMLPVVDTGGRMTVIQIGLASALLVAVSLVPHLIGLAGLVYLIGASGLGGVLLLLAARLGHRRDDGAARGLFLFSVVYLPAMLALLVLDRAPL
jgi:protoheme IX farnesyltransferase